MTTGRLARRRAEYARAETWYRRSIALGRQSGDWATYSMAFGGLGNLYMQRGKLSTARRFHLRALRAARRHSMRGLHGSALHDLAVLASEAGRVVPVARLAEALWDVPPATARGTVQVYEETAGLRLGSPVPGAMKGHQGTSSVFLGKMISGIKQKVIGSPMSRKGHYRLYHILTLTYHLAVAPIFWG